jgi:hypothetical protein
VDKIALAFGQHEWWDLKDKIPSMTAASPRDCLQAATGVHRALEIRIIQWRRRSQLRQKIAHNPLDFGDEGSVDAVVVDETSRCQTKD